MKGKILLIEDDRDIAELIQINLRGEGYKIDHIEDGGLGLKQALKGNYDLILLDLMLPGIDGFEFCKRFRREDSLTPIIMLTAKSEELDTVLQLELGADDYLTKPFSVRELITRIKVIRRRIVNSAALGLSENEVESSSFGNLIIYFDKRKVVLDKTNVELTAKEFDLLALFARNPGRAYSRKMLLDLVWGYQFEGYDHTVTSHINRLRLKIEDDPSNPLFITTVWGVGYRFTELDEFV